MSWKSLDTVALLERLRKVRESTTSANVGGFAVPFGTGVLRASVPLPPYENVSKKKRKKRR